MANLLKARGIFSLPNFLSEIPEGALIEALNTVIDRNGIIEPRRGFKQWKSFGDLADRAKQVLTYKDKLLVHYDDKLGYETSSPFVAFKDSTGISDAVVTETEAGRRIKGTEASNGNFYITTNAGVKRISSNTDQFLSSTNENQVVDAGVPQALDPVVNVNYTTSGWMLGYSRVAYRVTLGFTDNNDNLLLGASSGRVLVTNVSAQSCNTDLRIYLPNNLTTSFFVQIFRSNNPFSQSLDLLDVTVQPDDEVLQIGEVLLTAEDLARGYVDFFDTVPAELQEVGTPLYSNQNTGEGASQTNNTPPLCKDIASYKNSVFFANTKTRHSLDINLLSVEGIEDLEVTNASITGLTLTLTTGVSHGILAGERVFVVVPNTYRQEAYTSADDTADTLANSTLPDGSVVVATAAINGLSLNTFYFVRRINPTTIKLVTEKTSVVDITSTSAGTLEQMYAICGVYEATAVTATTVDITIASGTLTSGTLYKDAKIFPAHFITAKEDNVHQYYFGGAQGSFNLLVNDSVQTLGTGFEDKYFLLNSYDRLRPYTFYISLNDAAPALDSATYPDTAATIPANVVITDREIKFTIPLFPTGTQDNYVQDTQIFTKANHGLVTGDLINTTTTVGTLINNKLYFVKRIDDNTFQLTTEFNGAVAASANVLSSNSVNTATQITLGPPTVFTTSVAHGYAIASPTPVRITTTGTLPTVTAGDPLTTTATYYVNGLTATTFELYRTQDLAISARIDLSAVGTGFIFFFKETVATFYKRDNKVQVAQKISDSFDSYGDWNTSTTHKFTIPTTALTGVGSPPYYDFNIPSHGLSNGDRALVLANGTGPELANPSSDELPLDGYYVKVISSDNIELYEDSGLTNRVDFNTQGVGSLIILTNRLTCQNVTSGYFGYNDIVPYASQTNPDIKAGDSSFTTSVLSFGYGEKYNVDTDEYLVKRSRFPLVADKIDETARSLIRLININLDESVTAAYTSGLQDFTPRITFSSKSIDDNPIYFGFRDVQVAGYANGADDFEPTLSSALSASSSGGLTVTFDTSPLPHGLVAGDSVVVYSRTNPGVYTVSSAPTANTFTVVFTSIQSSDSFNLIFKADVLTTSETNPNRIYYSKFQQPDAVPLLNYVDVGAKNKAIERILALRDSLIILKEDGLFRISGDVPDIIASGFDSSNLILAPDSAAVLNNQIYAFTTQGVVTITENGATVASRFIENRLIPLTLYPNFKFNTFGVSYESDRAYYLFTPTETSDTNATQCWRYNTFTQAWTRWDKPATCGIVNVKTNKYYWGTDDTNNIEEERKSFDRTDYSDREFSTEFPSGAYSIDTASITLPSVTLVASGDALVQTQYVTLADIQNLALKLSIDPSMPVLNAPYYETFAVVAGDKLQTRLSTLITQLNTDLGTSFTIPTSSDFATLQTEYNAFIAELNSSSALSFNNYKESTGTKLFETSVLTVNSLTKVVTIDDLPPFVEGVATHFKGITSDFIYAPISLGDPGVMKQVREATTLFENLVFKQAQMGFATDLDAEYDFLTFSMQGSGAFGYGNYGLGVYGGSGPSYPFRTYLPKEKQRARYWSLRFKHNFARFKYAVLGVSVVPSSTSERAYR